MLNTKICHVFTLAVDIEKNYHNYEQILLAMFHENLTLPRGIDSILVAGSQ